MKQKIEKIVLSLKGTLVGYGIKEESILKSIKKNNKISECHLLNSIDLDDKREGSYRQKRIMPKKLKKIYGRKGVKTMLIDASEMFFEEKKLVSKFVYITSDYIYIYNIRDIEKTIKKYKRYHTNIERIKVDSEYILKIDVSSSKKHIFLDKIYFIIDSVVDTIDIISEILIS